MLAAVVYARILTDSMILPHQKSASVCSFYVCTNVCLHSTWPHHHQQQKDMPVYDKELVSCRICINGGFVCTSDLDVLQVDALLNLVQVHCTTSGTAVRLLSLELALRVLRYVGFLAVTDRVEVVTHTYNSQIVP
jgi:hypothetical protein